MHNKGREELSNYRLQKSKEMIEDADILFENQRYKGSIIDLIMQSYML